MTADLLTRDLADAVDTLRDACGNPWFWSRYGPRVCGVLSDAADDIEHALSSAPEDANVTENEMPDGGLAEAVVPQDSEVRP